MRAIVLAHETDWDGFRAAARGLIQNDIAPADTVWSVGEAADLFASSGSFSADEGTFTVPRALIELAETAIQADDKARFALLYRLIWRAAHGEKHLLARTADPEMHRATALAQAVRRETHKMRAFVRFREVTAPEGTRYVAWFEPAHHIVEANAPFFVRRFANMVWSILTPRRCAHWDGRTLRFTPGANPADVPDDDAVAAYWLTYYRSVFNPARLKVAAMTGEMPRRYWKNLPEAQAIPELIRNAGRRAAAMVENPVVTDPKPRKRSTAPTPQPTPTAAHLPADLAHAAQEAAGCRACPLWEHATQTVFGEGPHDAALMLVGEQPGDQEDLAGRPFVGPAGQVLDRALAEAGIDRTHVYVTNAVKHFKFSPRGKRRIHEKPDAGEIAACRFWLDLERARVRPRVTVLLGASAARGVLGRAVTIGRERGRAIPLDAGTALMTVHPSYLLRLPDEDSRQREYRAFVQDLRAALALA